MKNLRPILVLLTLLAVVACGGNQPPPREFPAATSGQVEHIEYFLDDGYSLRNAYTAPVDGGSGHLVAAEIVTSGGYVGVWWHGGTADAPGLTLAVNNMADEACVCPWVTTTQSPVSMSSVPAEELKRFVDAKVAGSE